MLITQMAGMNIENPNMKPSRFSPMQMSVSASANVNEVL